MMLLSTEDSFRERFQVQFELDIHYSFCILLCTYMYMYFLWNAVIYYDRFLVQSELGCKVYIPFTSNSLLKCIIV